MSTWLDNSSNSNNFRQSYIHGFLDISGGDINVHADNKLNIFSNNDSAEPRLSLTHDNFRVYDDNTSSYIDLSNNKLQYLKDVNEDIQTRLTDLTELENNTDEIMSDIVILDSSVNTLETTTSQHTSSITDLNNNVIDISANLDDLSSNLIPRAREAFSGGTGVGISDGAISIGQNVGTNSNVGFNNLTLSGNLTVNGTTTTLDTQNLDVSDSLIGISHGLTGAPVNDAGILINRGDASNVFIGWDESADKFTMGTTNAISTDTGDISITPGTLVANLSGNADTVTNGVYTTGNQTIGGDKTFSDDTTFNNAITVVGAAGPTVISKLANSTGSTHTVLHLRNNRHTSSVYAYGKPALAINWQGSGNWFFGQGGMDQYNNDSGETDTLGFGHWPNGVGALFNWEPNFFFTKSHRFGIGINAPDYPLDVNGTAHALDISASNSIKVGLTTITSETTELKGIPTAPTASSGTNTTQIATTAFVSTAVSNLVDSAPGTLDTLNELAAALGDDANYSTTISEKLGKVDISINMLDSSVNDLETTTASHTTKFDVLDSSVNTLETTSASHTTKFDVLDASVNTLETTSASHTTKFDVLDASVNDLETTSASHTSEIDVLDASVNTLKTTTATHTTDIGILDSSVNALETTTATHTTDIGILDSSVNALETTTATHTTEIGVLDVSVNDLETTSASHTTEIDVLDTTISDLSNNVYDISSNFVSRARDAISAGTGVGISDGAISIGQNVGTNSNVGFNNLTLSGNLTVNGTTTTLDTQNLDVSDSLIGISHGLTGAPVNDAGILINRGDASNVFIGWDESADKFTMGTTSAISTDTGDISITPGTLIANLSGNADTVTNGVYTTGNQTIGGSKTFSDDTTMSSSLDVANTFTVGSTIISDSSTVFVGTPMAPTANVNTRSNQIATTNYVHGKILNMTSTINTSIDVLETTTATHTTDIGILDTSVNTLETTTATHTTDIGILDTSVNTLETTTASHTTDIGILDSSVNTLETTTSSHTSNINVLDSSVNALETTTASHTTDIGILDSSVNSLETTTSSHTTDIGILDSSVNVLETTTSSNTSQISILDSSVNALESTTATHTSQISVLDSNISDLSSNFVSRARNAISAGTGVSISDGAISIGQSVGTTNDVTFNNLNLSGNLTVNGTTTTLDTQNLDVSDSLIGISHGLTGAPLNDAGILINRGDASNVFIGWDENADKFTMGTTSETSTSNGNLNIMPGTLVANLSGNADTVTNGVYTTGNQTIGGSKTFSDDTTMSSSLDVTNTFTVGSTIISDSSTVFVGTPFAPTATNTDLCNNQIATTAFVQNTISSRQSNVNTSILDSSVNTLETTTATHTSNISVLDSSVNSLETTTASHTTDIGILDSSVNALETTTATLTTEIDVLDSSVNSLETTTASHTTDIGILDSSVNALETTTATLTTEIDVLDSNISDLSSNFVSRARTAITAGTGVTYNNTSGAISIGQNVDTNSDVEFNDLTLSGTLDVTGVATAPTASSGTNSNQIATTAFVSTAVSNLVDSAPGTLDTLNELAAALGDDANYSTTISEKLGKVDISINILDASVNALESTTATHTSNISVLDTSVNTLETTTTTHTSNINVLDTSVNALETTTATHTSNISVLDSSVNSLETTTATHTSNIGVLDASVNYLETTTASHTSEISVLDTSVNALESTTAHHTSNISVLDTSVNALESTTAHHTSDISVLDTSVNALESTTSTHTSQISVLDSNISDLSSNFVSRARTAITAGTGVTYNNTSGAISIGQNVDTNSDVEFKDLTLSGTLDVTGVATAPTASSGTNTTQIATTAFVSTAVSNLVDSAPGTLDTLNELAAALGDDANYSTTISEKLGKVDISINILDASVNALESTTASHTSIISVLDSSVNSLETTTATHTSNIGVLDSSVNSLETTTASLTTDIGILDSSVNSLETTTATHTSNISVLDTSVNALESTTAHHTSDISVLDASVNYLETTTASHTSEISVLDTSVNSLETTTATHTSNISVLDTSVNALETTTASHTTDIGILDSSVNALETTTATLTTEIDVLDSNISDLSSNFVSRARTAITAGTGVTYNNTSGAISIGQNVDTNSDVEFKDLTLSGTLDVTGVATAPTASSGTNSNQIATTAFVSTAVSNLVDSAPGTLDTLNELAAALGDDANYSTTISEKLGKVDISINILDASVNALESTTATHTSNISVLDTSVNTLETTTTTHTSNINVLDTSVNALETTTATHTSNISVLDSSVNSLETTTATHTSNIGVLDASVNYLETTTANHISEISVLDTSVNALESTTATHTSNIGVLDTSVNALESTTAHHTSDISVLDTSVNALESTTSTHTSQISVLDSNISDLSSNFVSRARTAITAGTGVTYNNTSGAISIGQNVDTNSDVEFKDLTLSGTLDVTGVATAPTASSGTNTTQIATTAFVSTAVSNLVDSAPGTLDTLNELAAALGDDANYSTTISEKLGKVDISINILDASVNALETTTATHTSQISVLDSSVNSLETTTATHTSQISVLDTSVNALETTTETHTSNIGVLDTSVNALETTTANHISEISVLDTSVNALESTTATHTSNIGVLDTSVNALESTTAHHTSDISVLDTSVNSLETTTSTHTSQISVLDSNISDLSSNFVSRARTAITAGTGVTYNNTSGAISIGQNVDTNSDVEFKDLTLSGTLDVTGVATAPTASSGTNTTQIATTAFVSTAVSNLVDSAPGTLDTLNELAAALGDDANYSTTISEKLGKVDISINILDASVNALESTTASHTSIISVLDSSVNSLETTTATHTSQISVLDSSVNSLETTTATHTSQISVLDSSVNSLESTTASHTSIISVLDSSVNSLETTTATHTSQISVLDSSVNSLETTTATHTSNISVLDASVNSLETTTANHTSEISVLDTSVNALESTTATHTSNISVLDTSVNALETTTSTHTSQISVLDSNISDLSSNFVSRARNAITSGTGVTYNNTSGAISIGQNVDTNSDVEFKDLTLSGTLDVTGVATAPTASSGTNTTQIATTAFVSTAVSNLVDSAPGTLDTLNELAAALGDDANYSTTISEKLGKVDISINILDSSVNALETTTATHTSQISILDSSVNTLETTTASLTTDIGILDSSINTLVSTTATHTSNISILDTSVNSLETTTASHTSVINVLDASVNTLETTTATHTSNINVLDSSVNTLETTTASHTSQISILDTSVNVLETTTATHTSVINVLDASVNSLETTTATHTSQISILDSSVNTLETTTATHTTDIGILDSSVNALESTTASHTTEIDVLDSSVITLESTTASHTTDIGILDTSVNTLESTTATHTSQISILDSSVNSLETTTATHTTDIGILDTSVNSLETTTATHTSQISILDSSVNTLETTTATHTSNIGVLDSSVNTLETTTATHTSQISVLDSNISDLSSNFVSRARNAISAGTGVSISDGAISIGQSVGTTNDVTFNNLNLSGNLTVNGTTTTLDTQNLDVSDSLIGLSHGLTGAPLNDAGILINRGDASNVFIGWDENADKFTMGTTSETSSSTGNLDITPGILVADLSGNAETVTNGVYTTGNQTIGGSKIFSDATTINNTVVATGDVSFNSKLNVDGILSATDITASGSINIGNTIISSTSTTLAGTPTAPTAVIDTSSNQIATTAFVQVAIESKSGSGTSSSLSEQPPILASISKDAQSSYVDVSWVKFDEVYKDAFTGRSYPIYLQTFVDISFTNINSQSSSGWKTIRIGNGNYNTSGTETTPLNTLRFTAANGLNYNNSTGYSLSFTGKPGTDNLPIFTQNDTFDLRVYAVNNSGTVPAYIYISNIGLKTTGAPSAVLIKNTDTYTNTSFKMDVSFNLDSEDTSITSGINITEYDISYTLIDTKSNESMSHSGVFDLNGYNNKNNLTFNGLKPGSKYRVQIRAKNALNSEIGPYGDAFTGTNFTNDGTNRYINTSDLNSVSHNGMSITRGSARAINGKIVGDNNLVNKFVFSANNSNSKIIFGSTSSFYVNYGRQGKDFTTGTYVTATFQILKNGSVQYSDTMDFTNSASALTASIGAQDKQFTFTSASSYTDKGKTNNYSKGFVYSSSLNCTGNADTNSIFNANFPASTDKYKVQYTISSQSHNNIQRIDENGNASTSKNSSDFYVDDYNGTPTISYITTPTVSITGKTYLFGIPSITKIELQAEYRISNFAKYYIPYGTISNSNNIHSKSEVTSSKNGYSFGTVTTNNISTTDDYDTTFNKNTSVSNGKYNANSIHSLLVTVHYLDNSGNPTIATQTSTAYSDDLGKTFKDTTTTYSGSNLRFFNGSDTISGSNIDTDSTTFATTYGSHISSALLYFNGRFVAGGYSNLYNSTSLSPFSDWSTGFAVTGPNYSSYSNTGSGGFKWIAIQVSRSGNNVDLSNFKIGTDTGSATRHDNHLSSFGSKYKAYIYQDGKFGRLNSASNSGDTSWFNTGPTSISAAHNANGALQTDGFNAFVNSNGGTTLYLIVGIDQNSNHYFTF